MKRFITISTIVFLLFAALDASLGFLFDRQLSKIESESYKEYYILMKDAKPEILILGASNASHNFNSNILEDSLGHSVYNAAQDGQGMLYNKAIFDAVLKREKPKCVIIGLYYALLNGSFDDSVLQYSYLYGKSPEMTNAIKDVIKPWEEMKYISSAYRYNSNFTWLLSIKEDDRSKDPHGGYVPLPKGDGIITLQKIAKDFEWGGRSRKALTHILSTCQEVGIQCVVCLTPQYRVNLDLHFNQEIQKFAEKYGAIFIDYTNDDYYNGHPELFKDEMHLCSTGADLFTNDFVRRLGE